MAWITLTTDDVLSEFTPNEAATLRNLQGGSGSGPPYLNIDVITARTIDEVRGYILAGDYPIDEADDTTLPKSLFVTAIALARWRVLISAPQLKQLQTEERKDAYKDALAKLQKIADQLFEVEPPIPETGTRAGNWNSENKLLMRTHPVPKPAVQVQVGSDDYANPDAPPDAAPAAQTQTAIGIWKYSSSNTMADPGAGFCRNNSGPPSGTTQIAISRMTLDNVNQQSVLESLASGDVIVCQDESNPANLATFNLSAGPTDNGTWFLIPVTYVSSIGGPATNNDIIKITFTY